MSIWVFYITVRADSPHSEDSNVVSEEPERGKSSLGAHDNADAVSQWQQDRWDGGRQEQSGKANDVNLGAC